MANLRSTVLARRAAAEIGLMVAAGLFLGVLGAFGTDERSWPMKMIYWPAVIVGGGVIGIAVDQIIGRRIAGFWLRLAVVSAVMTPAVMTLVWFVSAAMFGKNDQPHALGALFFQVLVISFAVMTLRALAWRGFWTPTALAPPAGDASAAGPPETFRQRLPARHRAARLIAVEAEDHYLRVHTEAGAELVTARFSDALEELAPMAGHQTHRSWWVAADAIEAVRWRRGRGELRLAGGLTVPVSRTYTAALKKEGWF